MALIYPDNQAVQKGDHVCIEPFERGAEGKVTALFPKSGRAMIRFAPDSDRQPSSVPAASLKLLRRAA